MTPTSERRFPRIFRSPLAAACAIGLSIVGAAALRTTASPAVPPAAPAPVTVALVDLAKLMNGLKELKVRNDANQAKGQEMQAKLTEISDKIEKLNNDLKEGGSIPANDFKRRAEALAERFQLAANLKASREAYQNLYDTQRGNIIHDLYDKILAAIDAFAKREGYDMVLLDDRAIKLPPQDTATANDLNPMIESKRILFAKDGMDVTDRLVTIMNNQWEAANPGAATAPSANPVPTTPPATAPKNGNK